MATYGQGSDWRQRREFCGLSLRELSRLSGVNRGTISRIERGWPATAAQAIAIGRALERALDEKPRDAA